MCPSARTGPVRRAARHEDRVLEEASDAKVIGERAGGPREHRLGLSRGAEVAQ